MFGFLNILKPKGMTSHDVISRLRKILQIKQIGHSGTLDPLASGVLPVGIGKATRLLEYLSDKKVYIVTLEFGKISDTLDTEGNVEFYSSKKVTQIDLNPVLSNFIGKITQIPPAHSAVHYKAKRLYELARKGIIPDDIPSREVFVEYIKLISFDENTQVASLEISCSKGTYIRSIVRDIGDILAVGAVMTDLVRINSSDFIIADSITLSPTLTKEEILNRLINPVDVLLYSQKTLTDDELIKVKNGSSIDNSEFDEDETVHLVYGGKLAAIARVSNNFIKVNKVFI